MKNKMPRTPFSTPLSGSARETELRIRNIFSGPKKRPPVPLMILTALMILLCGNIVSCQMKEPEQEPPQVSVPSGDVSQSDGSLQPDTPGGTEPSTPALSDPVSPPAVDLDDDARAAYVKVLEDLLYRTTMPDGTDQWIGDMEENTFAVADVDGDGREELVLLTRPDIYAGYRGWVLDYYNNALVIQHEGFPSFTFYSNGTLAEDDSHAQGVWSDTFWPHSLYRYLPESDSYELAGHLSAWEKQVSDINPDSLPPFPTEKDISGAGILYYIHPISSYEYLNTSESRVNMAVDQSVYLEWLEPILGDAKPVELKYLPLTAENIVRLK